MNDRAQISDERILSVVFDLFESGDAGFVDSLRARLSSAPNDDPWVRRMGLAAIFEDAVRELADAKNKYDRPSLAKIVLKKCCLKTPRGLVLLACSKNEQTFAVAMEILDGIYATLRSVIGKLAVHDLFREIFSAANLGEIHAGRSLDWSGVRPSDQSKAREEFGFLLKKIFERTVLLLGVPRTEEVIEACYRDVAGRYPYLPAVRHLLPFIPGGLLISERIEHLKELDTLVDREAEDLSFANKQLEEQTGRLIRSVEDLHEANRKLTSLDAARSDFIQVVSHQFRTPLSGIRWAVNMLEDGGGGLPAEERAQLLSTIDQKAKFLIGALNKIFHTLAIDTESVQLDLRPTILWEIVDEQVDKAKKDASAKGVSIHFDRTRDPLVQQQLDPQKIAEVVDIVLTNAIQFTPAGGKVTVRFDRTDRDGRPFLALEVSDTGIGISQEEQKLIFNKFFRGKEAVRTIPDGTGLGMYIVKCFMEMHGGGVEVSSRAKDGTKVRCLLPLPDTNGKKG